MACLSASSVGCCPQRIVVRNPSRITMLRLQKFLPVLWNLLNLTHIINGKLASTRKRCKIFLGNLPVTPLGWLTFKKSPTKNGLMLLFFFSNGPRKNWYFGRDWKWYFLGWVSVCLESQNTSYKAGWIKNVNQNPSFYSSIFGGKEKKKTRQPKAVNENPWAFARIQFWGEAPCFLTSKMAGKNSEIRSSSKMKQ